MDQPVHRLKPYDVLHAVAVILICAAAAVFLHLHAGPEPPDNPGAAAQLAQPAATQPAHAAKAERE
jgi:hypothetical protein